jgi:prolyl 4-hydroxylase
MSPEAMADVRRRAEAGDGEALAFGAVLAALGAGEPQSWETALARLRRAAERGWAPAAGQLEVIGGGLADWFAFGPKERLCLAPRASAIRGFLPPAACRWLIERARGRTGRAQVFDQATGAAALDAGRSNTAFEFQFEDLDLVVLLARARIAAAVSTLTGALETVQVLHYAAGETFERHFDFLDPAEPGLAEEVARRGQRVATFLVYLNAGYEGGETDFPRAGFRFRGAAGDALMFANVDAAGHPERLSLHAGLPPTRGEKWVLSQWIRDRALA